jgi:hypothetical protein
MIRAHQPGSQPIDIPEAIPNPAVVPKQEPAPKEPAPKKPVKVPERVAKMRDCRVLQRGSHGRRDGKSCSASRANTHV